MKEIVKVAAHSRSTAVAGSIAGIMREDGYVEVRAIGASAVNQAMKALAIARGYMVEDGIALTVVPDFETVYIDGEERTALHLAVYTRPPTLLRPNGISQLPI